MIKEKTVLILGAGASIDSGFPAGSKLIDLIIEDVCNNELQYVAILSHYVVPRAYPLDSGYVKSLRMFKENLEQARPASIDVFLANNNTLLYKEIGKIAIGRIINSFEQNAVMYSPTRERINNFLGTYGKRSDNWYDLVWKAIYDGCLGDLEVLQENLSKLLVITFNYDRSLEHYLYTATLGMFDQEHEAEILKIYNNFKIFHVYGQVGFLPWQKTKIQHFLQNTEKDNLTERKISQEYNQIDKNKNLEIQYNISKLLCTYNEYKVSDIERKVLSLNMFKYSDLREEILDSKNIFVFGFGFHQQNLEVLKPIFYREINSSKKISYLGGTTFGMGNTEFTSAISSMKSTWGVNAPENTFPDIEIKDFFKANKTF